MRKDPTGKQPRNCFKDPKSPFWQYDFSIRGCRERGSTGERTAAKAAEFVESRKALMRRRQAQAAMGIVPQKSAKIGLADACGRYESKFSTVDKTMASQIETLCALLCPDGRDRNLSDFSTSDFADYRSTRAENARARKKPVSASTINREIELARRVWKHAAALDFDVGKMPNWTTVIDRTAERCRNRELHPLEEERLFDVLEARFPDLAVMAKFAMISGQRKAAIVGLRWSDVDLDEQEAKFVMKTKGENKRIHTVPLCDKMMEIIRSCPKVGPMVFTYECRRNSPKRDDRVFRLRGQRFPFSKQGWSRQWRAALKEAGVEDFRWHDLRHTAASRLLRSVPNLKMVQELLGHQSIDQSARYAHITKSALRDALEQVCAQSRTASQRDVA